MVAIDGWQRYLVSKVKSLQELIKKHRLPKEMLQRQLQPFFQSLLENPGEDCDAETLHQLLVSIMQKRSLSQSLENTLCLYLASRLSNAQIVAAVKESGKAAELSFLFSDESTDSESYMAVLQSMRPNAIEEGALADYLDKGVAKAQVLAD